MTRLDKSELIVPRLLSEHDVIYYVDKYTHENAHGEIVLDDDISVILEKCPAYRILVTKDRGGSE